MKRAAVLIVLISCLLLSGCKDSEVTISEDGGMLFLTAEEMGLGTSSGREGYFVLNDDRTFTPLCKSVYGYETPNAGSEASRFLWFTNETIDVSALIPTVTRDMPLVFIYNSNKTMPKSFSLEKYAFKGYTVGMHMQRNPDNSLSVLSEGGLETSDAGRRIGKISDEKEYALSSINGMSDLPYSNVDNNMKLLLGLEKGKYYSFDFYKGTKFIEMETVADTLVFQSEDYIELLAPYTVTKDGYFILNLPDNLTSGYYYCENSGLFYFEE